MKPASPKSLRASAKRSNPHPRRVEKRLAGLKGGKEDEIDNDVAAKWEDIHDPTRPNLYQDYMGSAKERKDSSKWKARQYSQQLARGRGGGRVDRRRHDGARLVARNADDV